MRPGHLGPSLLMLTHFEVYRRVGWGGGDGRVVVVTWTGTGRLSHYNATFTDGSRSPEKKIKSLGPYSMVGIEIQSWTRALGLEWLLGPQVLLGSAHILHCPVLTVLWSSSFRLNVCEKQREGPEFCPLATAHPELPFLQTWTRL